MKISNYELLSSTIIQDVVKSYGKESAKVAKELVQEEAAHKVEVESKYSNTLSQQVSIESKDSEYSVLGQDTDSKGGENSVLFVPPTLGQPVGQGPGVALHHIQPLEFGHSINFLDYNEVITGTLLIDELDGGWETGQTTIFYGGQGADTIFGWDGDDLIFGDGVYDSDNPYEVGGLGNVFGFGSNDDVLHGWDGDDIMFGQLGDDHMDGDTGDDYLDGGVGDDILVGGQGNDVLIGGLGNDELYAGDGDDILYGGEGDDTHYGGEGADTFVFALDAGTDHISGFNIGEGDLLDLSGVLSSYNPLQDDINDFLTLSQNSDWKMELTLDVDGAGPGGEVTLLTYSQIGSELSLTTVDELVDAGAITF